MRYPRLRATQKDMDFIGEFRGYNHNLRILNNEFYDMKNMTADLYPVLAPRRKRARVRSITKPNGLYAHNKLAWVDGTTLYYDGMPVENLVLEDSEKTMIGMGAYLLIWPDKVVYNTADGTFENMGRRNVLNASVANVSFSLCKVDGTAYSDVEVSATVPSALTNGKLWMDLSKDPVVLKQYSTASGSWTEIPTVCVKISAAGIGAGLSQYDGVTITGLDSGTNASGADTHDALNGDFVLEGVGDNYIVVTAIVSAYTTQTAGEVIVERKIPELDYVTECRNRVWGCKGHEIYSCKLGDPKNWNCFMGISTDSFTMTVGTKGEFTGCCTHRGYVIFFKEDVIQKIYGSKPSNYDLQDTNARGVEKGSEQSIVIVNETLFYKSTHDVCSYDSSLPNSISDQLGKGQYRNAVAGALGKKYYINLEDDTGRHMFVYDSKLGIWSKEDDIAVKKFAQYGDDLYFIADDALYSVNGNTTDYAVDARLEDDFEWECVTGLVGLDTPDFKYISKINLRAEVGDTLCVSAQYGAAGPYEEVWRMVTDRIKPASAYFAPVRCDVMRIKLHGKGAFRLFSMAKSIEQGSDLGC